MTATSRNTNNRERSPIVGERRELGRYSTPTDGQRPLVGQRVDGIVRFLPEEAVVIEPSSTDREDCGCRPRRAIEEKARPDEVRPKRPSGDGKPTASADLSASRCGRTGARVELARYTISEGERVLYGQRVFGVVRVTDNPGSGRGRAFLVERGLEQDGNAALMALIADYVSQATLHGIIPILRCPLSGPEGSIHEEPQQ